MRGGAPERGTNAVKPRAPPYLAFELDALPAARNAALAAGLAPAEGPNALLALWEHAWREQVEWVSATVLLGCCGGNEHLPAALVAFRFLEPVEAGWTSAPCTPVPIPVAGYRIRGARRYLRIGSPQSLGGHAAKANLIPGGPKAKTSADARLTLGSGSAATSADARHQRAANSEQRVTDPPSRARDTRSAAAASVDAPPLMERLGEIFARVKGQPYASHPQHDGDAMRALLTLASGREDLIAERWERALRRSTYPRCSTLRELARQEVWNATAAEDVAGNTRQTRPAAPGAMKFRDLDPGEDPYAEQAARGPV